MDDMTVAVYAALTAFMTLGFALAVVTMAVIGARPAILLTAVVLGVGTLNFVGFRGLCLRAAGENAGLPRMLK